MGLPFPPAGDLPDPGIEPASPALQADSLLSEPPGKQVSLPAVASAPNAAQPQASPAAAPSLCIQFYLTTCLFPRGQAPPWISLLATSLNLTSHGMSLCPGPLPHLFSGVSGIPLPDPEPLLPRLPAAVSHHTPGSLFSLCSCQ